MKYFFALILGMTTLGLGFGQADTAYVYTPSAENLKARETFADNKFGIFLHFGLYSMLGQGEWVMTNQNLDHREYRKLAPAFYPIRFDARAWVQAFKDAGARYICITTRHHDGFSLWNSAAAPDYNIKNSTPFGRDLLAELAEACREAGLKLHFYYSHLDWDSEDYPIGRTGRGTGRDTVYNYDRYFNFMNRQLTELLTDYGPIGAIWFDGWWDHDADPDFNWRLPEQYELIHKLQPACLIGNNHHQVPFAGEDIQIFERDLPGENKAGLSGQDIAGLPLETCQTMNGMWGYKIKDQNYKSADELIQYIVEAAGRNANLLLNIGPQPDGALPDAALERLQAIGDWFDIYGETVYGTRGGDVSPRDWGVTTRKGDTLYVHILNWPDRALCLPALTQKVKQAQTFPAGQAVRFRQNAQGVCLELPETPYGPDYVVRLILSNQ